jgi:hypothetical protein
VHETTASRPVHAELDAYAEVTAAFYRICHRTELEEGVRKTLLRYPTPEHPLLPPYEPDRE